MVLCQDYSAKQWGINLENSVNNQFYLFLFAIILGVILGVLNDVFRFVRLFNKNSKYLIVILDVAYMVICAIITCFFILAYNNGEVRFFALLGEFTGIILYRYTIGLLTGKIFLFAHMFIMKLKQLIIMLLKYNVHIILFIMKPLYIKGNSFKKMFTKNTKNTCKQ